MSTRTWPARPRPRTCASRPRPRSYIRKFLEVLRTRPKSPKQKTNITETCSKFSVSKLNSKTFSVHSSDKLFPYTVWCWSSSAEVSFQRHPEAARATNTQQTWRQEFLGSRSSTVERSAAAGTFLRFFQTIFENTSLWRLKRLVTLSTYRRYTGWLKKSKLLYCVNSLLFLSHPVNKCIYLSIYLYIHCMILRLRTQLADLIVDFTGYVWDGIRR